MTAKEDAEALILAADDIIYVVSDLITAAHESKWQQSEEANLAAE